jgi:hypothetical protein
MHSGCTQDALRMHSGSLRITQDHSGCTQDHSGCTQDHSGSLRITQDHSGSLRTRQEYSAWVRHETAHKEFASHVSAANKPPIARMAADTAAANRTRSVARALAIPLIFLSIIFLSASSLRDSGKEDWGKENGRQRCGDALARSIAHLDLVPHHLPSPQLFSRSTFDAKAPPSLSRSVKQIGWLKRLPNKVFSPSFPPGRRRRPGGEAEVESSWFRCLAINLSLHRGKRGGGGTAVCD